VLGLAEKGALEDFHEIHVGTQPRICFFTWMAFRTPKATRAGGFAHRILLRADSPGIPATSVRIASRPPAWRTG
jgi:uncharacterized membrane protein